MDRPRRSCRPTQKAEAYKSSLREKSTSTTTDESDVANKRRSTKTVKSEESVPTDDLNVASTKQSGRPGRPKGRKKKSEHLEESKPVNLGSPSVGRRNSRRNKRDASASTYQAMVTFSSSDWSTISWQCMLCDEQVGCAQDCIQHLMQHSGADTSTSPVKLPDAVLPSTSLNSLNSANKHGKSLESQNSASPAKSLASPTKSTASPTKSLASPTKSLASPTKSLASPTKSLASPSESLASPTKTLPHIEQSPVDEVMIKLEPSTEQDMEQDTELQSIQDLLTSHTDIHEIIDDAGVGAGACEEALDDSAFDRQSMVDKQDQGDDDSIKPQATTSKKLKTAKRKKYRKTLTNVKGPYTCDHCSWSNPRHYNFHRHILRHQTDAEPPFCKYCKENVTAIDGSRNFGLKSFHCELCQAGPMFRRGYEKHMLDAHHGVVRKVPHVNRLRKPKAPDKMKSYMCEECGFVSNRQDSFEKHKKKHTGENVVHQCPMCDYMTTEIPSMRRHQRTHKTHHSCQHCDTVLPSMESLRTHLVVTHGYADENLNFVCAECGHVSQNADELELHKAQHNRPETLLYLCEMCPFTSTDKDRLLQHQATHGMKGEPETDEEDKVEKDANQENVEAGGTSDPHLQCSECNQEFSQWRKLENHILVEHTEGQYSCQYCHEAQVSIAALNTHLAATHQVASLHHQCLLCGVVEQSGPALLRHKKQQHDLKEMFICGICGFTAARRWNLQRHKERHEMGSLKCLYCEHVAGERGHLYNHYIKIHQVEPPPELAKWKEEQKPKTPLTAKLVTRKPPRPRKAPCEVCGKNVSVAAMPTHMHRHKSILPYHCHYENCFYKAVTGSSLNKHIKRHHLGIQVKSNKPLYACSLCNYSTQERGRLVGHYNKKHNEGGQSVFVTEDETSQLAEDIKVDLLLDQEKEIIIETQEVEQNSGPTLESVLHQLPLQVVTEAIQDADCPQIMHLVLPENFEGTLHLQ